jgi:hypothetical protein
MESGEIEQRTDMKCCFKLSKAVTETREILVGVYGGAAVSGFERFRDGPESTEDEQRSGRPSTSTSDENVPKINKIIRANRRLTIREVFNALNISFGSHRRNFEHETSECEICSTPFVTRTERTPPVDIGVT